MAGMDSLEVPEINLGQFMIDRMRTFGSSIALVEAKTGRTYSYVNVIDKVERLAAGLRELGMGPGDVLCMMTYNRIDIPIFTLAVNLIGGVYQPLSPANTNDDLQRQFQECNTKFLVTTSDQAQRVHQMIQLIADYLQLVPPVAIQLIKSGRSAKVNLSSVKSIYSGAAPLGKEVETQLAAQFKLKSISQTFGLTETGIATVSTESIFKLGSAGKSALGTHVKIVDVETRQDLPAKEVGEILCKGPQMTMGYLNNSAATKDLYTSDNYLKTGDVGYMDEDGFLFVSDRIKELIKYKGYQVAPAYLEDLLMKHPEIADAAVIGVEDTISGELPKAFIVKIQGSKVTERDVIAYVDGNVAPHMRLRGGVEFIEQIPKSPSGKILRRLLRDRKQPISKL